MKSILRITLVSVFFVMFASCEKDSDSNFNDITGTYQGTITTDVAGKSDTKSSSDVEDSATAYVTKDGDQIKVRIQNEEVDMSIMMDVFRDNDDVKVCLTGNDFQAMYGRMPGNRGMNSGMNGNMDNANEWMQHLQDEHEQGDKHFGGFDMGESSFEYTFTYNGMEYHFEGFKQ